MIVNVANGGIEGESGGIVYRLPGHFGEVESVTVQGDTAVVVADSNVYTTQPTGQAGYQKVKKTFSLKFDLATSSLLIGEGQASLQPSSDELDFGIVTGAIDAEIKRVSAGSFNYRIIAADYIEPALNSRSLVINLEEYMQGGQYAQFTYHLPANFSKLISAEAQGNSVLIKVMANDPSHFLPSGGYAQIQTNYLVRFRPESHSDLSVQTVR